jgi:hypothetical protein
VPLKDASEFLFQINRPRQSKSIPGIEINRLSRWSSSSITGFEFSIMPAAIGQSVVTTREPAHATRIELDVSTPADRRAAIPQNTQAKLFVEMSELAKEIVLKGDVS